MKRWLNLVLLIYFTRWTLFTEAQCPAGFQTMSAGGGCACVYLGFSVPAGVTVLSSQQFCLNMDNRSSLIAVNGDAQMNAVNSQMASYVSMMGLYNIPAAIWIDESNTQVHFMENQTTTDPLSNIIGKCYIIFRNGQYLTNNSCLMYPQHIICQFMCDATYPPPGIRADGVPRCGEANFNMTCQDGWINLGGLCYKNPVNNSTLLTYAGAQSACASVGGWLPSFSNLQEWQAVVNYVFYTGISGPDSYAAPMWLGGMYNGTSLTWNDGTPTTFQYWAPGQPNNSYSCPWWSVGQGSYWSTGDCSFPHGVVFCQSYQCPTTTSTTTTTTTTTAPLTTTVITTTTPLTTTTTPTTTTTTTTSPSTTTTTPSIVTTTTALGTTSSPTTTKLPSTTTTTVLPTTTTSAVATTSTSKTMSTTKAPNITTDFNNMCNSDPMSFYSNGVCYTFYPTNKTATQAAADCASRGTALAVVRSADIAEDFITYYMTVYPNNDVMTAWIGTPTNTTDYNKLQNTVCTDGSCWLHISIANGQCSALSNVVTSSDVWIVDNVTCTSAFPYFCEKLPTFEQKGCGQLLNGVVVQSVTLATISVCAQQCAAYDWCTGVNYNQTGQLCQILKENSTVQSLTCYNGWEYFERL